MRKAVIFDFDGVIVDSENYWPDAINRSFRAIIPTWRDEDNDAITGMIFRDIYFFLKKNHDLQMTLEKFTSYFFAFGDTVYPLCSLITGVEELIQNLQEKHIPIAIASSSRRKWIEAGLENKLSIDLFPIIVSNEEIPEGKGKPHPYPYLKAAELLAVQPAECIAIEDSVNGVTSAKAAGMYCIGYRATHNQNFDLSAADIIIENFADLDIDTLMS